MHPPPHHSTPFTAYDVGVQQLQEEKANVPMGFIGFAIGVIVLVSMVVACWCRNRRARVAPHDTDAAAADAGAGAAAGAVAALFPL